LIGDSLYCYYIVKPSTYCNNSFDTLVYVTSNISCDTTFDIVAPCPPLLSIQPLDCETFDASLEVENILTWEWDLATCEEEQTEFYELFYKAKEEDEFVSLVKTVDTFYIQKSIDSYAGCYKIRAQDRSGNLGVFSDEVCNYNCESIVFPNVVTPNDDEKNDIFGPIPSPQFVEKIQFSVSNRWGKLVFQSDKGIEILWDLKNDDGEKVSDGVYYYEAVVTFDKYKEEDREKTFKGWIFVVR
jgi:gliding motility-associated-like protein